LHPDIIEAACIGVDDEKTGEAVKLFVVKSNPSLGIDEVMDYCRDNFTGYKVPKDIEFIDELPKSNVGKVLRRSLRE
jgi:long-chain acyl-CoA synthetase